MLAYGSQDVGAQWAFVCTVANLAFVMNISAQWAYVYQVVANLAFVYGCQIGECGVRLGMSHECWRIN
jgi:hypothetical protein